MCRGFTRDTLAHIYFLLPLLHMSLEVEAFVLTPVAHVKCYLLPCRSFGVTVMVPCSTMTGSRLGCMRESIRWISSRLI